MDARMKHNFSSTWGDESAWNASFNSTFHVRISHTTQHCGWLAALAMCTRLSMEKFDAKIIKNFIIYVAGEWPPGFGMKNTFFTSAILVSWPWKTFFVEFLMTCPKLLERKLASAALGSGQLGHLSFSSDDIIYQPDLLWVNYWAIYQSRGDVVWAQPNLACEINGLFTWSALWMQQAITCRWNIHYINSHRCASWRRKHFSCSFDDYKAGLFSLLGCKWRAFYVQ